MKPDRLRILDKPSKSAWRNDRPTLRAFWVCVESIFEHEPE